jgi:uncharacterized protein (TIGR03083 family)
MDDIAWSRALAAEGGRFGELLATADRSAPVPGCPGWTVHRLADHLGRVHRNVAGMVRSPSAELGRSERLPHGPEDEGIVAWYQEGFADLSAALAQADLDAQIPTWAGSAPMRFWLRRMAQETAVHRWDEESALVPDPAPVDAELAVDGIDELLDVFVPLRLEAAALAGDGATLHLHATDAAGEWLLRFGADGLEVERAHAKGDAAARGTASDLLLFLWGRVPPAAVEVFGDAALLQRWQERARF